ncbi:MAG: hypothetical protein ACR2FJ_09620 [Qipengyuania sp.]
MSETLASRAAAQLAGEAPPQVTAWARSLGEEAGALGVLFYGSNLRTGSLEGVLDFYILLPGEQRERIWPRVSYREEECDGRILRAKIATMSLAGFAAAAEGKSRDTTIWARFVQPSALLWARDEVSRVAIARAVASAAITAARLAAVLGPRSGSAEDYWRALFGATYRAEFRIEKPGREDAILSANAAHFAGLLPLAWEAGGIVFDRQDGALAPQVSSDERHRIRAWWHARRRLGKPLNLLRLAKATTTFEGAADYAAWKLERHAGIRLEVTPFRAQHPLLAAPGALLELWRRRRAQR